jgi:ABC-type Zn uptake system ZnuABC Zn-binding protein ZnuA
MLLRSGLIAVWLVWASTGMAQERIPVVTTTSDLRSLVEAVGGDRVAATSLVPANFDAEETAGRCPREIRAHGCAGRTRLRPLV